MTLDSLTDLFVEVDNFFQLFDREVSGKFLAKKSQYSSRKSSLIQSEIMTILIGFHMSHMRTFKHYYLWLLASKRREFPNLVSYNRFIELAPSVILPLLLFLYSRKAVSNGIAFIDSTVLRVCHNKRISRNKVFAGSAAIGKSSMGWFYGFKLHLVINEIGELINFKITPGNIDDRAVVPDLIQNLIGKVFADKGYIGQELFESLLEKGVQLITSIKKNMKNRLMPILDKILLRKRSVIETVIDQLKNISQIEHSRHRCIAGFMTNTISALIAYTFQPKKPSVNIDLNDLNNQMKAKLSMIAI